MNGVSIAFNNEQTFQCLVLRVWPFFPPQTPTEPDSYQIKSVILAAQKTEQKAFLYT